MYNRASDPSDLAAINITNIDSRFITLDIVGTFTEKVYFKGLKASIVDDDEATLTLGPIGATVLLRWKNPGTIDVSKRSGVLPANLRGLVDPPQYWNSKYLHTS